MATLPQFQTADNSMSLMQNTWATILQPFLNNPSLKSIILPQVQLAVGSNTINHRLQRKIQGWRIIRLRGQASIYDTQDGNTSPTLTLLLTSDAAVSVDLECF